MISPNTPDAQYVISFKQRAKFAVGLGDKVSPSEMQLVVGLGDNVFTTDIKQGMRVGFLYLQKSIIV